MIETVDGNKRKFSKRDVKRAKATRRFERIAAFPGDETMRTAVINNTVKNSPITLRDIELTNQMLGKDMYALQGKGTQKKNMIVNTDWN